MEHRILAPTETTFGAVWVKGSMPRKVTERDHVPRKGTKEEGTWLDVYSLHFPPPAPKVTGPTPEDLGLDGYDRHAGTEVPTHPVLKGPGDTKPKADPFAAKKH